MGYFSHAVEASDLEAGDHIYTWRKGFIYSHHGIYVGDNKVVHFTNDKILCSSGSSMSKLFSSSSASEEEAQLICSDNPVCCLTDRGNGVIMSCLNCFLRNGSLRRYQYGVGLVDIFVKVRSGTCTTEKSDPPETVIKRAMRLLDIGFGRYHYFKNNCEDFALYCKTGLLVRGIGWGIGGYGGSGQASAVLSAPMFALGEFGIGLVNPFSSSFAAKKAAMSSLLRSPLATVVANPVGVAATVATVYISCKVASDIGLRSDAVKVDLEDVPAFMAKKLGR